MERRVFAVSGLEVRTNESGARVLSGYAAVFGSRSEDLGGFHEELEQGAFCNVLGDDCRLLINHDGIPLARTASGTLELREDTQGLHFEAPVDDQRSDVQALISALERGDINQCSFGFMVRKGGDRWSRTADGDLRTIQRGGISRLLDVSVVTFPAYPDTEAFMRGQGVGARGQRPETVSDEMRAGLQAEAVHKLRAEHEPLIRSILKRTKRERRATADQIPAMGYGGDPPEGSCEDWIDDLNRVLLPLSAALDPDADGYFECAMSLATFGVNGPGFCVVSVVDWWYGTCEGFWKQAFDVDATGEPALVGSPEPLELVWQPATGGTSTEEGAEGENGEAATAMQMELNDGQLLDLQRRRVQMHGSYADGALAAV